MVAVTVSRLPQNPLITPRDVRASQPDWEVVCAFNAGVARLGDEVVLLLRVAERPRDVPNGLLDLDPVLLELDPAGCKFGG